MTERKVRTCFWFARRGIDAAQFYVTLLPDSRIDAVFDHGRPDDPMVVEFTVAGAPMMIRARSRLPCSIEEKGHALRRRFRHRGPG